MSGLKSRSTELISLSQARCVDLGWPSLNADVTPCNLFLTATGSEAFNHELDWPLN
mgnify:CR=1 FL=1